MSALEKAARAAYPIVACARDFYGNGFESFDAAKTGDDWSVEQSYEVARAVLMAVREPDEVMSDAGAASFHEKAIDNIDWAFTAMIDAAVAPADDTRALSDGNQNGVVQG